MRINIKNIAVILGLLVSSTSCDNFLDVHPQGEILGKDLLTDRKGFENAMYGVYATMRTPALYGKNMSYYTLDIMAQYFSCQGNQGISDLLAYNYYKNADVKKLFFDIWSGMYQNISYVNNVLINLEKQSPQSLELHDIYKGEALGLRAFMHFDLLRLFTEQITNDDTKGIVYSTAFSVKPADIISKKDVLHRIISELREAEHLLDNQELYDLATENDAYLRDRNTHFNLHAARATLARVYMTIGNTDSASYYAEKVIKESGLSLVNKTEIAGDIIGTLSKKETIFGLYSKDFYTNTKTDLYDAVSFQSLDPRRNIQNIYSAPEGGNDYRLGAWFMPNTEGYRFVKLTDKVQLEGGARPEGQIPGINLIRLPEMYYIMAECLLDKDADQAKSYFNAVLESRGLTHTDNLTLSMITNERYKEFIGEGQTFFNMKRLNLDIVNIGEQTIPASNTIYVINIPEEEFNYRY